MSPSEFWNSFHDGTILNISGQVPGQVVLDVSIGYLRTRFPGVGSSFRVTLSDCTKFVYAPYDEGLVDDLSEIAKLEPMVLSVDSKEPLKVDCVMGTLFMEYRAFTIVTDANQAISGGELKQASVEFWREWSAKHVDNT